MSDTLATLKFTSGTFEMTTTAGRLTTKATLASNGLCYHPAHGTGTDEYADEYRISHLASGKMLCAQAEPFPTKAQCEQFITRVDGLADWTSSSPVLSEETQRQVYAVWNEVEQ